MSEARDVEEIVSGLESRFSSATFAPDIHALIADWRAKKAEIERLLTLEDSLPGLAAIEHAAEQAAGAMRAKCEAIARPWLNTSTLKLRAAEMTAQESRSVKAVVRSIADAIAALKP